MADTQTQIVPVILAGGVGSRLWPASRTHYPKQFQSLLGDHSFLQKTLLRASKLTSAKPVIVCNEEHRFLVAEQCRQIGQDWEDLILEPQGRNSAPAIALAALRVVAENPHGIMLVLPSDHLINDETAFADAVAVGREGALDGGLVTFGVTADRAETGYGYIQIADPEGGLQAVQRFVEKPDQATAQSYFEAGNYLWNSGMFVLGAKTYLDELAHFSPEIANCVAAAMDNAESDMNFIRPGAAFLDSPSDSIDYAVMEKTDRARVIPVDIGWNDIGSWSAIWDESARDEQGNHLEGDVVCVDTTNSYLRAGSRLVGAIGVDDVVVVETKDAVLVAGRDHVQNVKAIVERLAATKRSEHLFHAEVFRPWGSYEGIAEGDRYQVKCIKVAPGASLSLQLHHHRSEHWIVVRGTARVTRENEVFTLGENESTYIPRGAKHRLENPGKLELELIEVQAGPYLGEDDIERFEDIYGR